MVYERCAYVKDKGIAYLGYDLCTDSDMDINNRCLISEDISRLLDGTNGCLFNSTFVVKPGDAITVVPECSLALADIRKSYTIKRAVDAGVCNVFSPIKSYTSVYSCYAIAAPCQKRIYFTTNTYNRSLTEFRHAILTQNPDLKLEDLQLLQSIPYSSYLVRLAEPWKDLIEGKLQKPAILIDRLSINSQQDLTVDALYLTLKAAFCYKGNAVSHEDIKNYELQLNVLNNYNWREYPGTMTLLQDLISSSSIVCYMKRHKSFYTKTTKNLLFSPCGHYESEKDYNLGLGLFQRVMNLGDRKVVRFDDLCKHMNDNRINLKILNTFYSQAVKLEVKQYEDYCKDTVCG